MANDDPLIAAIGQALVEAEQRAAAALAEHACEMRELVELDVARAVADLPPPRDGRDGIDRVMVLPRHVGPAERFERNELAWWRGGIWQAVRNGQGDPETDPAGWKCLVPGIGGIELREDFSRRETVFGFRMSDGTLHECRARMMPALLPPDAAQMGWGIIAGDIVHDGEVERIALIDDPREPCDWATREIRGRRGRDGKRGEEGPPGRPGPGLAGLTLARDAVRGGLVILPHYADPAVKAEPVAVDLLLEEPGERRHVIVGFAGQHQPHTTYARGDVVGAGGVLWLSLKADNDAPLREGNAWERMT